MNRACCRECGKELDWRRRSDTRYCDAVCRKRYSRRKSKIKQDANRAMEAIRAMRSVATDDAQLLAVFAKQLARVEAVIESTRYD